MGRLLRSLLMVPAIARQLKRIADLETAVAVHDKRLNALEERIQRLSDTREKQALVEELAKRNQEIRILKVSYGADFEELEAAGKVGTGTPYRFEELLSVGEAPEQLASSVPPLVFVHVPKTGGTTLNNILMKNFRYRLDSYGSDFFPRYFPEEFVSLVQPPNVDDTRRPAYFTGHINLANDLFRYMPVRYVAITMLREPVSRIISFYRFHSTLPNSPHATHIRSDALSIVEFFKRNRETIQLQHEIFAPRQTGIDDERPERIEVALRNIAESISVFGFQEDYDAFLVLLAELLGLPDVSYRSLNTTPVDAATVTPGEVEKLRHLLSDEIAFYEGARKLYEQRIQTSAVDIRGRLAAFNEARSSYNDLRNCRFSRYHPWRDFYA